MEEMIIDFPCGARVVHRGGHRVSPCDRPDAEADGLSRCAHGGAVRWPEPGTAVCPCPAVGTFAKPWTLEIEAMSSVEYRWSA